MRFRNYETGMESRDPRQKAVKFSNQIFKTAVYALRLFYRSAKFFELFKLKTFFLKIVKLSFSHIGKTTLRVVMSRLVGGLLACLGSSKTGSIAHQQVS